jgi:hypothetical protein
MMRKAKGRAAKVSTRRPLARLTVAVEHESVERHASPVAGLKD